LNQKPQQDDQNIKRLRF